MAYTPTTWATGDTITASAMNKIENGIAEAGRIAVVCVDYRDGGINGSAGFVFAYAKYNSTLGSYSIESNTFEYYVGNGTIHGCFYIPVPLPSANDDLRPFVFFTSYIDNMAQYEVAGDISTTKVEGHIKAGASAWDSTPFFGFEVSGDGKIAVSYYD